MCSKKDQFEAKNGGSNPEKGHKGQRSACSELLEWANKRKGYIIGGRELLRRMQECGCMSNADRPRCECNCTRT